MEQKIKEIVQKMTQEQKVSLLCGKTTWTLQDFEEYGLESICLTDGPHGVRLTKEYDFSDSFPATILPCESAMASSFDVDLVYDAATKIATECHEYNVNVLLGPGVNIKRSPLGGRNFEYYSEDPYLSGKMASSFINGLQSNGVGASLKHFILNEQETRRMTINSIANERTMRELYYRPFEIAIKESNPYTIMSSYNKVNGTCGSANSQTLINYLRDEMKWSGVVVSDWGAAYNRIDSHKNGLDLAMPGPSFEDQELLEAINNNIITLKELDQRVENIIRLILRTQAVNKSNIKADFEMNHETAKKLATSSIVLLKNNNTLPLNTTEKIAVIGEFASNTRYQGGGSSKQSAYRLDQPLEYIKNYANVDFALGYSNDSLDDKLVNDAIEVAKNADKIVLFTGTTERIDTEGIDRVNIDLPENQLKVYNELVKLNKPIIIINHSGSVINFEPVIASDAIIQAWLLGSASGSAIADILFGKANPSGRLSESFIYNVESNPTFENFPGNKESVEYHEQLLVGYRYYDTKKIPCPFPFGYGLSYSEFKYNNLSTSSKKIDASETIEVTVEVQNISNVAGEEVVLLFVEDLCSTEFRPKKELKAFKKIYLTPGETQIIKFELDSFAFEYWNTISNRFEVEPGEFNICICSDALNVILQTTIEIENNNFTKPTLNENDCIDDYLHDEVFGENTRTILGEMGIDENNEMWDIIKSMPLNMFLTFAKLANIEEAIAKHIQDCIINNKPTH